ncbi:unnamed protein product [Blepharisma stoltei]|uniref:C2 domain-containing protein n=1 Tax=Blepharisma stoltei TaxID=1481888 RepID=A0AAU9JZ58_9CILI|nr:unnamed protein product [Blepharisma stoltei]
MLLSMTITPNDTPETGPSRASPYREPISKLHIFRSILYELKNVRGLGSSIRIRVSIGNYHVFSRKAVKRETTDSDTGEALEYFQWGDHYSGEIVDNIKEIFPIDPTQVPDVVLDLYSEYYLAGEARVGYIRKPISEMMENDHPKWIPFKSIDTHSEIGSDSPGLLLASLAYFPDEEMKNRTQISKPRKADKWLCWNIYGGFDIAPSLSDEEINLQLKVYCGDIVLSLPEHIAKENIGTKYPIWKWSGVKQIQLHEDLHFEQNLRVELHNKIKALKLYWTTLEIGQFSVPLHRCDNLWSQPHFFHVINASEIGASQGRLLADFYISKTYMEPENNPCVRNNESILCNIDFALIGIRNLVPHYENPSIVISIPGYKMGNGEKAEIQIGHMKNSDKGNPNFLSILHFPNIELPVEPIYLPAIYVKIKDNAFLSWNECYTYIPLIPYAQWIKDEVKKQEAQDLYTRNFTTKDLIEQAPLRSLTLKKIRRTEQFSFTDYGETSEPSVIHDETNKPKASMDMISDIYEPKNSKVLQKIQFDKLEEDEEAELEQRENEISEIEAELVDLRARAKSAEWKKGNVDEKLKKEIRYLEKTLETLNEGAMTEFKFLKIDEKIGEDDFQYNRPVYKGGLYEESLDLPYQRYLLFTKTKNTEKLSAYKVGEPNGAVLKACIRIKPCEKSKKEEFFEVEEMRWGFDFFHPIFQGSGYLMKVFEYSSFAVRLYLLRGLSLSAVSNAPDWTAFAGGLEALSSADSYPEILTGEDKNQAMKYICDNRPETQTLNPEFFRTYELKADFPSDWKLEINIWNLTEYRFDSLIGTTAIDLEDRYYGEKKNQDKLMVKIVKEFIDMEINNTQDPKYRDWLSNAKKLAKKYEANLENNKAVVPVEYRTLHHKGKSTAQGMLELFLELYESSEAKLVPLANISKPCPEEYELRLILWKCEGIPKENDTIDIYFRAHFDPTGWLEEATTKETDCHVGSEDGKGVFNWRMKFHFQLPCSFARLRLVAYEFNTFGDDRVISEVVLDLTQYFKRVIKEGKLKLEEEWVELHLPNLPGTNGGKASISFDILSLAEANQRPVGEGQNEPNRDPELDRPEVGRGVSDYIKGTAIDVFSWPLLNMSIFKKILSGISIGGMLIVMFIYPGYLTGGR